MIFFTSDTFEIWRQPESYQVQLVTPAAAVCRLASITFNPQHSTINHGRSRPLTVVAEPAVGSHPIRRLRRSRAFIYQEGVPLIMRMHDMQPVQREWQQRHDIARRSSSTRRETSCTFNPPASRAVECGAGVPQIRGYITCGECSVAMATVPLIRSELIVHLSHLAAHRWLMHTHLHHGNGRKKPG